MIKIGNLNISSFKLGGADCSIYLGSVKLYPTEEPTPPTPMNVITYQASEKLAETTNIFGSGLHTNKFSGSSGQQLTITSHAFENGVGTIEFDGDITSIGSRAFNSCGNLTSVNIPNSVTSIGGTAFNDCTSLTSIDIPSGVTSIGGGAFNSCRNLTSVTVNATTPPTMSVNNAFDNTNNCPIYVPSASIDAYKSATNWSTYASRIQAIPA